MSEKTHGLGRGWLPGRRKPYKFTKARQAEFLRLTREGMRRSAAARKVGLTPSTVIHHAANYPEFAKALDEAEREATDQVEDALFQSALGGNVTAQQVWLYNRAPERWRDARYQVMTVHGEVKTVNLSKLATEDLLLLRELLMKTREIERQGEAVPAHVSGLLPVKKPIE